MSPNCSRTSSCFHRKSTSKCVQTSFQHFSTKGLLLVHWLVVYYLGHTPSAEVLFIFSLCQDLGDLNKKSVEYPTCLEDCETYNPSQATPVHSFSVQGEEAKEGKHRSFWGWRSESICCPAGYVFLSSSSPQIMDELFWGKHWVSGIHPKRIESVNQLLRVFPYS